MTRYRFCPRCATPLEAAELHGRERLVCPDASCGFIHWDNPVPVVAAIITHPDGVLLVRNKGWPAKWFGLVTGFLERDETAQNAVLREVEEELGLKGRIESFVGLYPFFQMNQILMVFHLSAEGVVAIGDELEAYKAVPEPKLKPWSIGTGPAVRDWLAARR